ncbi:unnamed protein product, partial [Gongylonema pulchrum]|uniref:Ovule protein n=1 Tax=Gongylonema pulchrum TaxID=637853 RepID=A0A183F1C1_9BILA
DLQTSEADEIVEEVNEKIGESEKFVAENAAKETKSQKRKHATQMIPPRASGLLFAANRATRTKRTVVKIAFHEKEKRQE